MRLLLATRNPHKKREISDMLRGDPVEVVGLDAFPNIPETVEDAPTLEGNARKKAREGALATGLWALADDTGLEVHALGGKPGVLSARFAGPGCGYDDNNRKLLLALSRVPAKDRKAAFRTVMALCDPSGARVIMEEGRLDGAIAERPSGANGFGYDPVFLLSTGKTLAELSAAEKNSVSHRARALQKIVPYIKKLAATAACLALICGISAASKTEDEPGQRTIWDEIMAEQANRGERLGYNYLEDKRYDLAQKEFERAVAANPRDATAQMMLGVADYWLGEVDKSLECYKKSLELDPTSAQAYMLVGISLAWKGDVQGAYDAFKKASDLDPGRADIQMNLGSIEDSLNKIPEALDHFRRAVQLSPKEPLYHYQLGMLYRKLGRDQDAADSLAQALKLYPQFEDALLELGAVDERRGDRRAAIHDFKRAVDLKARDSVARFRLGRLYLLDGDGRRARDTFADAFNPTPEGGGPGLQLSVAYAGGKSPKPAPGQAPPSAPKPAEPPANPNDPLQVFARNLERVPLEQSAIMQVDVVFVPKPRLVKAAPESASALKKALARQMQDQDHGAPKAVRREYQLPSGSPEQREKQIAKVIDDLRDVMGQAPEDSDVRLGMNLNYTRLADAGGGKPGGAGAGGRTDAESQPKVTYQPREVGNDLGLWIIGTGWMSMVEEVLPEPGETPSHPDQSDWWVSTGLGYATLGDGQRALTAFERAVRLDPQNEAAWLGRGVAEVMTGDEKGAETSLQEALKINPKNRPASEGLKWLLRPSPGKKKAS